jgi:hypothetical protein
MGTSPLPNPQNTPPLGGKVCPDPRWNGGRALVLSGPQTFLGALQVLTASAIGQPAAPPPVVPVPPFVPDAVEGSVPFTDVGETAFVDEI